MTDTLLWYTTRGAGAVSMILLSGVVILGVLSSLRFQRSGWPRFLTPALHRNLALMTVVFLACTSSRRSSTRSHTLAG